MNALSKAFASGSLRGENFNSVIAGGGRTVQALADGLGVGTLQLREMAEAGELTTGRVIDALTSQMEQLRGEAELMPATISDGFLLLGNAMFETIGRMDQTLKVSSNLSGVLVELADRMSGISDGTSEYAGTVDALVMAGQALGVMLGARLAVSLGSTAVAMGTAATATRALSTAMALLGGPVGIAITVVAGLAMVGKKLYDNKQEADALEISTRELAAAEAYHSSVINGNVQSLDQLQAELSVARGELHNVTSAMGEGSAESLNMSREVGRLEALITEMGGSIEQTTSAVQSQSAAIVELTKDEQDLINTIESKIVQLEAERMALNMTERELFIHNATIVKGTQLTAEQAAGIRDAAAALYDERSEMESATKSQEALTKAREDADKRVRDLITSTRQQEAALALGGREQAIYNALIRAGNDLTSDQVVAIANSVGSLYDKEQALKAVNEAQAETSTGAVDLGRASEEAARQAADNWQRTHEYLTTTFIDIFDNGKSAFRNIADSFTAMIKRMVAEWAASKLMNLFGIGGGSGATATSMVGNILGGGGGGTASSIASSVAPQLIGGSGGTLLAAGGQFLGGITGTAVGAGSALAGPPTAAAAAGSGIGSSIMAGISAIPGWGWAIAGVAAAAALLAKDSTPSSNAGMLVGPAPGAPADRTFSVSPFASGFQPKGFARREDQSAATDVINQFALLDAALTESIKTAGGNVNMSGATLSGFSETGQGAGVFMGLASEKGKGITSVPIEQQLRQYATDVMRHASGLTEEQKAAILGGIPAFERGGIHSGGLALVGERGPELVAMGPARVINAQDTKAIMAADSGMVAEMRSMLAEMRSMAYYTKRTSDLLLRVTRDGDSLVTVTA
jgi:tape measure domain-containing protein